MLFICPKCKNPLFLNDKSYKCSDGHCYDIAKKGYVNLLMSQVSSERHHGDDKIMARARADFLGKDYYKPLAEAICDEVKGDSLLDIGCGECYYLSFIKDRFPDLTCVGIDISKEILEVAGARIKPRGIKTAVASGANLPVGDNSFDTLLSVFAPITEGEFLRVLKKDGILIRVTPMREHLYELKEAVYDKPLYNDDLSLELHGFEIVKTKEVKYTFTCDKTDAKNLFAMTPYYYKTSPKDKEKLDNLTEIKISSAFFVTVYKKH